MLRFNTVYLVNKRLNRKSSSQKCKNMKTLEYNRLKEKAAHARGGKIYLEISSLYNVISDLLMHGLVQQRPSLRFCIYRRGKQSWLTNPLPHDLISRIQIVTRKKSEHYNECELLLKLHRVALSGLRKASI